ncbi:nitrilase-related carbon-nitrogen hydrolase [Polyangium sp. 15x6]|uniref:nitrilase-related carbon-nitrogen hydrolase n=1 Tax=Polyangium sp. 15x6 TaxID=3042687 RepID=UPI00249B505F|nr:nitrilase-related carbon-nitrogen hydrolase [Polyangium sp. 15x6]MDI3285596.1 nitrilase-related carbon-nitrogen hydrolase [Polyangium sp. 15x6]
MIIQSFISDNIPPEVPHLRLGLYQGHGTAGDMAAVMRNLEVLREAAARARTYGVHLLSFPELFLTGYDVTDAAATHEMAESIQREGILDRVAATAKENGLAIICPYPEAATVAGERRYYDSIVVHGPDGGLLKNYRKTHLWGGDERNSWSFGHVHPEEGEAFTVFRVHGIGVGVLNCYEAEFPELCRILALKGAQLVVIPTAADEFTMLRTGERTRTAYPNIDFLIRANAYQNEIFCAYSNRKGLETQDGRIVGCYLGNSCLVDPHGHYLLPEICLPKGRPDEACCGWNDQMLMIADCVPGFYGPTHPETMIGDKMAATHYMRDRRWNLYGQLTARTYVDQTSGEERVYPEEPE